MSLWSALASIAGGVVGTLVGGPVGGVIGSSLGAIGSSLEHEESNSNYLQGIHDTNAANIAISDKANQEAYRRMLEANRFSSQSAKEARQYNEPSMQLMRLRNAGINPSSLVSNVPATQVSSAVPPAMSAPTMQAPQRNPESGLSEKIGSSIAQFQLYDKAKEEIKSQQLDNHIKETNARYAHQEKQVQLLNSIADLELKREDLKKRKLDYTYVSEQINTLKQQYRFNERTFEERVRGISVSNDKLQNDIDMAKDANDRDNQRLILEKKMADANIRLSNAQITKVLDDASYIREQSRVLSHNDLRGKELHEFEKRMRKIQENIGNANYSRMLADMVHEEIKDQSEINMFVERLFGLGFRDIGNALSSLTKSVK